MQMFFKSKTNRQLFSANNSLYSRIFEASKILYRLLSMTNLSFIRFEKARFYGLLQNVNYDVCNSPFFLLQTFEKSKVCFGNTLMRGGGKVKFGYARVSSKDQNPERQIESFKRLGIDERNIYIDKESGGTFNRTFYNLLVGTETSAAVLREGDVLVIDSIDRLGRNYSEITVQWNKITNELGVSMQVLDMPLLNTEKDGQIGLDQRFISDLILQILSYVAEKERENNKRRQRQGIDVAKAKGVKFGRPSIEYPENWEKVYSKWKNGEVKAVDAMIALQLTKSTFYKLAKIWAETNGS